MPRSPAPPLSDFTSRRRPPDEPRLLFRRASTIVWTSCRVSLKDPMKAFCVGSPGAMKRHTIPASLDQQHGVGAQGNRHPAREIAAVAGDVPLPAHTRERVTTIEDLAGPVDRFERSEG